MIDASGRTLGRIATEVAVLLRGKHKPTFTPNVDDGDFVHVTNLRGVRFTGSKFDQKDLIHHSHHPGGLKSERLSSRWERDPARVLREAVYNMLPANKLRDPALRRLTGSVDA